MQIKSNHMWPKNYSFNFRSEVPDCRRPDCIHSRRQVYTTKFTSYTWDVTCIQTLYQLTLINRFGNGGKGSVVGLLKVGHKKLFLLDEVIKHLIIIYLKCVFMKCFQVWSPTQVGKPNELVPLCVLDFYVAERRQRSGCGSKLFQHMLIDQRADPRWHNPVDNPQREQVVLKKKHNEKSIWLLILFHNMLWFLPYKFCHCPDLTFARYLAVDRPSVKLVSFLRKHYGLVNTIPQVKIYFEVVKCKI